MRIKQINPRGWYDIPGYDGKYQINYFGNVRRALKRGYKALHPYIKTTNGRRVVKLNCKEQVIMKLMQITFIGELPPGMVTYHKNGIITDDALNNIGIITRSELGRLTGRGNGCETSVVKISEEGQIVDFYRSVREAGRKNHMSYQTILDRINRDRETLVIVRARVPEFYFNRFINQEEFCINMQSKFIDDTATDRALLLKFAGTVESGTLAEYGDDGVTQKATVKTGIASKGDAIVPNPVKLKPYRTFLEVDQPASEFVFRMKQDKYDGVLCALFEADGGAWKMEATERIKKYLESELKEYDNFTVIS